MKNLTQILLLPLFLFLIAGGIFAKDGHGKGHGNDKGGGNSGKPTMARVTLKPTGSDTDASGFAETFYQSKKQGIKQSFHVKVEKVAGNASYTIVVDGNTIDTFTSTSGGTFEAVYETDPHGSHRLLPMQLNPVTNIKLVEIKDSNGDTVLTGDFTANNGGGSGQDVHIDVTLTNTGVDTDASGKIKIEIETEDGVQTQKFELEVEHLAASSNYQLFADGVMVGMFTTDADGKADLKFSSNPKNGELPLPAGLDLTKVQLIEIKDSNGQTVLTGSLNGSTGGSGNKSITLTATGTLTGATGQAMLSTNGDQKMGVQISNVTALAVFLVKLDGKLVGAINTNSSGQGQLNLTSGHAEDCAQPLPASVVPLSNAHMLEIDDATGAAILTGTF